jgi:MOSC domain-containing protein YiiM
MSALRSLAELEQGIDHIRRSPADEGRVELVVRRPAVGEREVIAAGTLDVAEGLVGDTWRTRRNAKRPDGSADPDKQLTLMNARAAALVAVDPDRVPLAGDQLYVDLDLSEQNLPPGTRLALGEAVVEITPPPHTGCKKFSERFGQDAIRFVNSPEGRSLRLRGVNARVVAGGAVRAGDAVRKLTAS